MLDLLKLEFRKNKFLTYLLATLCIFMVGFGFCFFFAFIPQITATSKSLPNSVDTEIFTKWDNFIMLISILFTMCFSVLSAVMHMKFTVEEYIGKSSILLFSYPQSRSKILFVKCSFVFVFTALGLLICNTFAIFLFALVSNTFGILPNQFEISMLGGLFIMSCICGLLAASVGLIAMRIGFWKKSLPATIVTAIIIVAPFSNAISLFPQHSTLIQLAGMVVLLIAGLVIFMGLLSNVNKMEVL